jgi:hypothetical protein
VQRLLERIEHEAVFIDVLTRQPTIMRENTSIAKATNTGPR